MTTRRNSPKHAELTVSVSSVFMKVAALPSISAEGRRAGGDDFDALRETADALEPKKERNSSGYSLKVILLGSLVVQNATLNVAARWSRVVAERDERLTGCGYSAPTAVAVIELVKVVASVFFFAVERRSLRSAVAEFCHVTRTQPLECAKMVVPALLYTVQNNLLLVAADNLEGPILALFGQLKILTTAVFSVLMLRRALGRRRWLALFVLTCAIAVVQISQHSSSPDTGDAGTKNVALGLSTCVAVACISGFAGVYFEMVLKASSISVWARNIHLGTAACIIAVIGVYTKDSRKVERCGFLGGYGGVVWLYVATQAVGGLLIAMIVKFADNILKAFATSVAIIAVALISNAFFAFALSPLFFVGGGGVVYAIFLYGDLLKDLPFCGRLPPVLGGKLPTAEQRLGSNESRHLLHMESASPKTLAVA
ncbi:nucleotide-sugar transporter-domain-containing protein [Pelagophyceae sp. CCMP2097]|nr:nucleotide-sugar transporter-domain-containing protein [Pelagophyceae sp. CCMP2097]